MSEFNCNSRKLVNAIKSIIELGGMSPANWVMAREKPDMFVSFMDEHMIEVQQEFEKGTGSRPVYPRFISQDPKVDRNGGTFSNKIGWIKMVRTVSGLGLKDSKDFVEQLPNNGDFKYFCFGDIDEANDSKFKSMCDDMRISIEWVPCMPSEKIPLYKNLPFNMQLA